MGLFWRESPSVPDKSNSSPEIQRIDDEIKRLTDEASAIELAPRAERKMARWDKINEEIKQLRKLREDTLLLQAEQGFVAASDKLLRSSQLETEDVVRKFNRNNIDSQE